MPHESVTVPHAVVELAFGGDRMSAAKAWRKHLGLTRAEVAERMGISRSDYTKLEGRTKLRKPSRKRVAAALGIADGQLDF